MIPRTFFWSFSTVQTTLTVASNPLTLVISGVYRSSTPFPDGPFTQSYAGCLSAHAVCPPEALTTSKIVLVRIALCGQSGTHAPWSRWRGSLLGSITFSETFCALYRSIDSSNTIMLPAPPEQVV